MVRKQRGCLFRAMAYSGRPLQGVLAVLAVLLGMGVSPTLGYFPATDPTVPNQQSHQLEAQDTAAQLVQQGKELYASGQFTSAVKVLEQAEAAFRGSGDKLALAMTLSNLSLAYQQLGQWSRASEAIATSLQILQTQQEKGGQDRLTLFAQSLDVQGRLQFAQGQLEQALSTWQQAAATYAKANDDDGHTRSIINQAQALQALGLYRRALEELQQVNKILQDVPDSPVKATGLRSLGNALRLVGNLDESQQVLQQSLATAQRLQSPQDAGAALLSLGNTARASSDTKAALAYYQQAAAIGASQTTTIQAQLNQLSVLVETEGVDKLAPTATALWSQIQPQITNLPSSRAAVDARINVARSLMKLSERGEGNSSLPTPQEIAQMLATAVRDAKSLGDPRAQSYALGELGRLYEERRQWKDAIDLTQQALLLAQSMNASDIAYRWQWQLGRLLKAQGKTSGAIAAYTEAVNNLKSLRTDLVAVNPDIQFSFRESVEPVYRELVALLLQPSGSRGEEEFANSKSKIQNPKSSEPSQKNLAQARDVIESLQLAELVNFFRANCLDAKSVKIDQVDTKAAVIYPIILPDRLEVILSLPNAPLRHYTTLLPQKEVDNIAEKLRQALVTRTSRKFLPLSQQVYDWLIRPAAADLAKSEVKTLVFVLDGPLRNIPMAALYDGQQYLVEQYGIALTPGLQLLTSQPLVRGKINALTAGLTEARDNFGALPNVALELNEVKSEVSSQVLLNEAFTRASLQNAIKSSPFPVVHLATHGQFSSKAEQTFILTWDGRINVKQFNNLLQTREERRPIELLVLSACQTAAGDKRAALGLAGMAVRAGARSTLATLWYVDDAATAPLMAAFYRELNNPSITKAEALRRAQLSLLKELGYKHPIYWAPYVLVGNWQ